LRVLAQVWSGAGSAWAIESSVEQLAAGLMAAHGRFDEAGHAISLEYQPLVGLVESGNTAIITFHLAIVAIY